MFVLVRSVDLVDTRCKILALVLLFFFRVVCMSRRAANFNVINYKDVM